MSTEIFFSYAHEDEELRDHLAKRLKLLERMGLISAWYDRDISAGTEWAKEIDDHLNSAKIILLLVSPDFLASEYCWDIEVKRAMERHQNKEARVIPVILRPSAYWSDAPFGKLQALPKDAKPVTTWETVDLALENVVEGIRKAINEVAAIEEKLIDTSTITEMKIEPVVKPPISNIRRQYLDQQLKELQVQYDHHNRQIEFLSQSDNIDDLTPQQRFRLNQQIAQAKNQREEAVQKIEELESQFN